MDVYRVFFLILALLISSKIVEQVDILRQFRQGEGGKLAIFAEVVEVPVFKVTY